MTPRFLTRALGRPTLFGQGVTMVGSLGVVGVLTRGLTSHQFGTYSIMVSMFAFANALVGTTLGINATRDGANADTEPVMISARDSARALLLPVTFVVIVAVCLKQQFIAVALSAVTMVAIIAAEIMQGVVLGRRRFRTWTSAACWRAVASVGAAGALVAFVPAAERGAAAIASLGLAAVAMCWRCWRAGLARLGPAPDVMPLGLSEVGVINLSLWLMSTGDRVILGWRAGLGAVAVYAVVYGLLDRVLRAVAVATAQSGFPLAMSRSDDGTYGWEAADALSRRRHGAYWLTVGTLTTLLVLLSGPFVGVLSGGRYKPGFVLVLLLATGISCYAAAMPYYVRVVASDRTSSLTLATLACATLNLGGNAVIDGRYGAHGAAAMTLLSYGLWAVAAAASAHRVGVHARGRTCALK